MAKIPRALMKIFGSNAGPTQIAKFGSLAAGSPAFTADPVVIQSLANYLSGWFSGVIGANSPAIEDMNALCYLFAYQLSYGFQAGVPEYDATTTYYIGSFVNVAGVVYVSLTDTNIGNTPASSTANWKVFWNNPLTSLGDMVYSLANGVPARVAPNTTTTPAFLRMTGTGAAGALPAWAPFAKSRQLFLTAASGTYTTPAGCLAIFVRAVGGGGGGGGCAATTSTQGASGAGGGGGAYVEKLIVAPNATYAYVVGAGGAGGISGGLNAGLPGGQSTFGSGICVADAGTGGGRGPAATTLNNMLFIPGTGGLVGNCTGDFIIAGGAGFNGPQWVFGTNSVYQPGPGGPSYLSTPSNNNSTAGMQGGNTTATIPATKYGGGGGGASSSGNGTSGGGALAGSNGADGCIIVDEFYT